jgi:hypothetical protein
MTAAFLTAATLGFGKHGLPVTQDGQIISAAIVFFALGLWGFASSHLTRAWLHVQETSATSEMRALGGEIEAMRQELKRLADALDSPPKIDPTEPVAIGSGAATSN